MSYAGFLGRPLTDVSTGFAGGSVSTGFIQATPGDMKSFRSSVERIALIFVIEGRTACIGVWLAKPLGCVVVMDKRSRGSRKESILRDDAPFDDSLKGCNENESIVQQLFRCRAVLGDARMPC